MAANPVYIAAAKRSPIGKFLGGLSKLPAPAIAGQVAKAMLDEVKADRAAIGEVYFGQVLQSGVGQSPARQVALAAGIPDTISCSTINKVCGSGLQAVMFADMTVKAGDADVVLAGGMESMSLAPFFVRGMRTGNKFGNVDFVDGMLYDGLTNVYDNAVMGVIAEETATKACITRKMQDEWALRSHQRAAKADKDGLFNAERVAIEVPREKAPFAADETYRADASFEALAGLKPAFAKDGTVTPGNSSALSDGAAAVLVCNDKGLAKCGGRPLARIVAHATAGGPPRELFFAPINAVKMVCAKAGWDPHKVDLYEFNEAFAAQLCADLKGLEMSGENVNVNGGAIALGHPIGASGARVLVTLVHAMKQRGAKKGIAALCLGGGNAVAMAVEAV